MKREDAKDISLRMVFLKSVEQRAESPWEAEWVSIDRPTT
jgi:hypothetical protein